MLIDSRTRFADAAAIAGTEGTVKLGSAIDLGITGTDMGEGDPVQFYVSVNTAAAGGTSVAYELVTADNAALDSNPVVLYTTGAIVIASQTLGAVLANVSLPKANYKRYLGVRAVRVGTVTAGAVTAALVGHAPNWKAYAEANS